MSLPKLPLHEIFRFHIHFLCKFHWTCETLFQPLMMRAQVSGGPRCLLSSVSITNPYLKHHIYINILLSHHQVYANCRHGYRIETKSEYVTLSNKLKKGFRFRGERSLWGRQAGRPTLLLAVQWRWINRAHWRPCATCGPPPPPAFKPASEWYDSRPQFESVSLVARYLFLPGAANRLRISHHDSSYLSRSFWPKHQ